MVMIYDYLEFKKVHYDLFKTLLQYTHYTAEIIFLLGVLQPATKAV